MKATLTKAPRCHAAVLLLGSAFGFSLSFIGFSDFSEVHRMFLFADLRMIYVFGATVAGMAAGYALLQGRAGGRRLPDNRKLHKGSLPGGVLFGAGWALTGACPAIALVQLGEGKWPALFTAVGIILGILVYRWARERFLHLDSGTCG